jgi:hypothetical protein
VAAVDIQLNFGPPADRYEAVPAPRHGYIWSPGHWQWNANNKRHFWTAGTWERDRPGYAYQRPQWVERDGRWHYQARRWDSDRDGIPDRRDPTPYGANRGKDSDHDGIPDRRDPTPYGNRSRDSDRDGVPDRSDRFPNNPNRS